MSLDALKSTAWEMVDQLAGADYELLLQRCDKSRLTRKDLHRVIRDYGRKLVSPPRNAYENLDTVQVKDATVPNWSVRAPLWTEDQGRSDLTLELTVTLGPDKPNVELDDLHVL